MKLVICLVLVLLVAVSECRSYGVSSRWDNRGYSRSYGYRSYYRRRTCQVSGCSPGYTCRRREFLARSSRLSCLPDPRAAIRSRLTFMEKAWNSDDFSRFFTVFSKDVTLLPDNLRFRRGTGGIAQILTDRKAENQWGDIKFTLDSVESITDNFVSAISFLEIQSVVNAPILKGKMLHLWKPIEGTYFIDTICFNFDPPMWNG